MNILNSIDPDNNHFSQFSSGQDDNLYYEIDKFQNELKATRHGMTILNFNIRSFNKNIDEFIAVISSCNIKYDIIVLTETWLRPHTQQLASIPGYVSYHCYRDTRDGGGVSVFIKDNLKSVNLNINIVNDHIECIGVKIHNKISDKYINIIGLYRPPHGKIIEFNQSIENLVLELNLKNISTIITGDFNICILDENNPNSIRTVELFQNFYFRPLIHNATRITESSSSLLDQIWCNMPNPTKSGIVELHITDHFPVFSEIEDVFHAENTLKVIKFRDFSDKNMINFRTEISDVDWDELLIQANSSNNITDLFLEKFNIAYDKHFPILKKRIGVKRLNSPWITTGIIKSIRLKHLKLKQVRQGLLHKSECNLYCSILSKTLKKAKILYFDSLFYAAKNDLKKSWKIINSKLHPNKNKQDILLCDNDKYINKSDVPDVFNILFSNIGNNLKNAVPNCNSKFSDYLQPMLPDSMYLSPSTADEVKKIITSLKSKPQNIHRPSSKIYKFIVNEIASPINMIFNKIIENGLYPDVLKRACVTPVFKSGDKHNASNYRPINSLNILNTIIEKLLSRRINEFLKLHNIITDCQYGFRSGYSTNDAVIKLLHEAHFSLNHGRCCGVVSLDLSKAFDTVDHSILLSKLYNCGVRGVTYNILKSYLTNRTQFVAVNGIISSERPIDVGVPQGSVLGPLLFSLYVNDIPNILEKANVIMYADDTTLFYSHDNINNVYEILNYNLAKIDKWLMANYLTLNVDKTNYILITNKRLPNIHEHSIAIRDKVVERKSKITFLGVTIDDKLRFKDHINLVCNKVSKSLGVINKLNYLPKNILKSLYYTLIFPYLIYCILAWGSSYPSIINPLVILQKRAVRIITNNPHRASSDPLFKELSILKFKQLYDLYCSMYMYKVLMQNKASFIKNEITGNQINHSHELRHNTKLRLPKVNLISYKQSFVYNGLVLWNKLDVETRNMTSIHKFRKTIIQNFDQ